jgi:hypothetical protein
MACKDHQTVNAKKHLLKILVRAVLIVGLVLMIALIVIGSTQRSFDVSLSNGGHVRITPAPTLRSLKSGATTKIFYQPISGHAGEVVLWDDFFDHPLIVLPATDTNVLLCLYDFDVDLRLLRIDPAKNFKPLPTGSPIGAIICSSPWQIEPGTIEDWQETQRYLKQVSKSRFRRQSVPAIGFGIFRIPLSRDALLNRLESTTITVGQNVTN